MDDGLQHFTIAQDLKILVIDSNFLFGNKLLFPAGPLRENYKPLLKRVDLIILIGTNKIPKELTLHKQKTFLGNYQPKLIPNKTKNYLAFSGLANNQKFFNTLKAQKLKIAGTKEFKDHHPFTEQEIESLIKKAKTQNLTLITTSKDHIKLPPKYQSKIINFQIKLSLENEKLFTEFFLKKLKK